MVAEAAAREAAARRHDLSGQQDLNVNSVWQSTAEYGLPYPGSVTAYFEDEPLRPDHASCFGHVWGSVNGTLSPFTPEGGGHVIWWLSNSL